MTSIACQALNTWSLEEQDLCSTSCTLKKKLNSTKQNRLNQILALVLYNSNAPTDGSPFSALTKLLKTEINISLAGHCKESSSTFQIVYHYKEPGSGYSSRKRGSQILLTESRNNVQHKLHCLHTSTHFPCYFPLSGEFPYCGSCKLEIAGLPHQRINKRRMSHKFLRGQQLIGISHWELDSCVE